MIALGQPIGQAVNALEDPRLVDALHVEGELAPGQGVHDLVDPAGELLGELLGVHGGGQHPAGRRHQPAAHQTGGVRADGFGRDEVGIQAPGHLVEVQQGLSQHCQLWPGPEAGLGGDAADLAEDGAR